MWFRVFNEHNEEVKRHVPADKLLVFTSKDGWEPLCAFLGVPVPDKPFPHVNDSDEFKRRLRSLTLGGNLIIGAGIGVLAAAAYAAYKYLGRAK